MNVEYVSCKISAISWLKEKQNNDLSEAFWLCGTYLSRKNFLTIYSKQECSNEQLSIINQIKNMRFFVNADVVSIDNYDNRSSLVSLENGQFLFVNHSLDSGFDLIQQWHSNDTINHRSAKIMVNNHLELVSCGLDGKFLFIDIQSGKISKSPQVTSNSLHCFDKVSENEFVCGTTSGHVKMYDKRTQKTELSLRSEMATITAIKRNTHIPHIVACGNDIGLLYIWDLRNNASRPMQPVSVHTAEINCLKYLENDPNIIITSGLDGQLIKWNISNDFEVNSVESIIDKKNSYPINCFDIYSNQIVFADDNEVLYLTTF